MRPNKKTKLLPNSKFRNSSNNNRMNHIKEQMNNVEEKMLQIDAIAPVGFPLKDGDKNAAMLGLEVNSSSLHRKDPYASEVTAIKSAHSSLASEVVGRKQPLIPKSQIYSQQQMLAPMQEQDVSVHLEALDSQLPDQTLDRAFVEPDSQLLEEPRNFNLVEMMARHEQTLLNQSRTIDTSGNVDQPSP